MIPLLLCLAASMALSAGAYLSYLYDVETKRVRVRA